MSATKFLDAIARMPNNHGEDSDAFSAYTQVNLDQLPTWLGAEAAADLVTETWISLPRDRRPKEWDNIDEPMVRLKVNLYGHPLAGLIWEKHCQHYIMKAGFERIPGWECLFVHRKKQLFLSVYVDDFRMAGRQTNISPMWKTLGANLDLEPPVPSCDNTYLGCNQK